MMTVDEAIAKAEQWRKENACGDAAKVAIALLNELERVQALRMSMQDVQKIAEFAHDMAKRSHPDLVVADALAGDRMALYARTTIQDQNK